MRKTTMAQVVEFAGQLNVTLQNISEDENTHGLAEAYNRLAQVMDELCIPMREEEVLEPISHEEACETAERLYRQLIRASQGPYDHTARPGNEPAHGRNSPSSKALTDSHGPKARTSNGKRNSIG